MSKTAVLVVMLCGVLAAPVLGVWKYDSTDVYISEPYSDADPYGTWWYGWDGDGDVDAGALYLDADGWTSGNCGVWLSPIDGTGLSQYAYVSSRVYACSHYHWEGSGDKAVDFTVETTMSPSRIYYYGYAVDDTHVSVVRSTAAASADGGCGATHAGSYYPSGWGSGWATTQSGSGASNNSDDVTVSENWTDWWNPAPYLYNVGYEGDLRFTASTSAGFGYSFSEPWILTFDVEASVGGSCVATGQIQINDPNYYYLNLGAEAEYDIDGETRIDLYGNIQ